jgi:RNA polymerase sigma-70 factor (ECF subfamily)
VKPPPDEEVRGLCDRGEHAAASALLLERYGGEIMRFLFSRARNPQLASEAFATFSENVHRGIPTFEHRASTRTWVYTLAYHALLRELRANKRASATQVPISDIGSGMLPLRSERSATPLHLRSEVKQRMALLRQRLADEDQALLELRITRQFAWRDIARILGPELATDPAALDTEAARLRKRFQIVREQLRQLAIAEGLLVEAEKD